MSSPDALLHCMSCLGIKVSNRRLERVLATLEQAPGEPGKPGLMDTLIIQTPDQVAQCADDEVVKDFISDNYLGAKVSCILPTQPPPPNRYPAIAHEGPPSQRVTHFIRESIEKVLILSSQQRNDKKAITLHRPLALKYFINEETGLPDKHLKVAKIVYSWPGKNKEDAKHFGRLEGLIITGCN